MTLTDDHIALAAEFVLGTLPADEQARAEQLIGAEPDFAALVRDWERKLGELNAMVATVEPPDGMFDKIKEKLGETVQVSTRLPEIVVPPPADPLSAPLPRAERVSPRQVNIPTRPPEQVAVLRTRVRRLRDFGAAMTAIAAVLAVFIVTSLIKPDILPSRLRPKGVDGVRDGQLVAVLQRDAQSPAFVVTVDLNTRQLVMRRVAADNPVGRAYQLWLVSANVSPRSLGIVSREDFTTTSFIANVDATTISNSLYAISLEPEGGSPTGFPTGPVLWSGRMIEASPPPPPSRR